MASATRSRPGAPGNNRAGKRKRRQSFATRRRFLCKTGVSALTGFEPFLRFVNHINTALATHDAAIAMTLLERAEGVTYLHGRFLHVAARGLRLGLQLRANARRIHGGRYWDRTSDPFDVNEVLYR